MVDKQWKYRLALGCWENRKLTLADADKYSEKGHEKGISGDTVGVSHIQMKWR